MFCPQCGNNVKDGARFCGGCGWAVPSAPVQNVQPAEQHCASCGTVLKEGARFCPNCGGAVPPAPVASEPLPPSNAGATAKEAVNGGKSEPEEDGKKSDAIDKAVLYCMGKQAYTCFLYKDGVAVGSMTDTQGTFIPDVREWLENKYDNLVVEIKEKG